MKQTKHTEIRACQFHPRRSHSQVFSIPTSSSFVPKLFFSKILSDIPKPTPKKQYSKRPPHLESPFFYGSQGSHAPKITSSKKQELKEPLLTREWLFYVPTHLPEEQIYPEKAMLMILARGQVFMSIAPNLHGIRIIICILT